MNLNDPREGWMPVISIIPTHAINGYWPGFDPAEKYEFARDSWDSPSTFSLMDMPDWYNIAGLYWREVPCP